MRANITYEIAQAYGLTIQSLEYFAMLAQLARNWDNMPLVDTTPKMGSFYRNSNRDKGYLTALKQANLLVTEQDEWNGHCYPVWALFTERGAKLAADIGITVEAKA